VREEGKNMRLGWPEGFDEGIAGDVDVECFGSGWIQFCVV
jgi:hypothetical protein